MTMQTLVHRGEADRWDQAIYAFLAEKERRSGSMRTVRAYSGMLYRFFGTLGKSPDQVAATEVFSYAHGTGLSGKKPSSVTTFTENITGGWDWFVPAVIIFTGTFINVRFTSRLRLLVAWLVGFAAQAGVRHLIFGSAFLPSLGPMTGMAFLLFTFYMVTDPPTTPSSPRAQVAFGLSVAAVYGLLMAFHVVFGLFFALVIVCTVRGSWLFLVSLRESAVPTAATIARQQA